MTWIALRVVSGREIAIACALKRHFFAVTYVPTATASYKRRGKMGQTILEARPKPVFSGLVWVRFRVRRPTLFDLRRMPSVLGALAQEGRTARFSPHDMDVLRRAAATARRGTGRSRRAYSIGDSIKIKTGLFAGRTETIVDLTDALASFDVVMLGRRVRKTVPISDVEKAA